MITPEEILKKTPNLNDAWELCNVLFPDFGNLTIPMQGMVAGSFLTEQVEYYSVYDEDGEEIDEKSVASIVWDFPPSMLDSSNSFRILTDYRATLAYARNLFEMHLNWGLER